MVRLLAQGSAVGTVTPPLPAPRQRLVCAERGVRVEARGRWRKQAWEGRAQSWVAETADGAWSVCPTPAHLDPLGQLPPPRGSLNPDVVSLEAADRPASSSTSQPMDLWNWLSGRPADAFRHHASFSCTRGRGRRGLVALGPWQSPGPSFACRAQCWLRRTSTRRPSAGACYSAFWVGVYPASPSYPPTSPLPCP